MSKKEERLAVYETIRKRADARGLKLAPLSRQLNFSHAYFSQYKNDGTPKEIDELARTKLAKIIGGNPDDYLTYSFKQERDKHKLKQPESYGYTSAHSIDDSDVLSVKEEETIPLYGPVTTTIDNAKPWNVKPIGQIDVIPELEMVPNGYAVRLAESLGVMPPNTILHVDPFLTEVKGALVLVRFKKAPQPGLKVKIHAFVGQFDDTYGDYYHFINEPERIHVKDVVEIGYIKGAIFP